MSPSKKILGVLIGVSLLFGSMSFADESARLSAPVAQALEEMNRINVKHLSQDDRVAFGRMQLLLSQAVDSINHKRIFFQGFGSASTFYSSIDTGITACPEAEEKAKVEAKDKCIFSGVNSCIVDSATHREVDDHTCRGAALVIGTL